jgi:hypothetical protein
MAMLGRVAGPRLTFTVHGRLSRTAKAGVALCRLGAWLIRVGGVTEVEAS